MHSGFISHLIIVVTIVAMIACRPTGSQSANATSEAVSEQPSPDKTKVVVDSGVVRLAAQNVFKDGETKVDRLDIPAIPNAPAIPSIYRTSVENYHVTTTTVATGVAAVIKVNAPTETEFKEIRILRLESNDMYPNGYMWQDCTAEEKDRPKTANDKFGQDYAQQFETYLPDFEKRTVACLFDRSDTREGHYFVVVRQIGTIPTTAFTSIRAERAGVERIPDSDESIYILRVANLGPKDAAEVNLYSHFDSDTEVVDTETTNGRCQRSRYGSSHGSMVCYLGHLASGENATIRFRSKPSPPGYSGRQGPHKPNNEGWFAVGVAKELESDGYWPVNSFKFGKM